MKKILVLSLCMILLFVVPVKADITSQIDLAEDALGIDNSDKKTIERVELLESELGLDAGELSLSERVAKIENELGIQADSSENVKEEINSEDIPEEEKLAIAPSDDYVMERLQLIDTIVGTAAVTEDHDPNGQLNKAGGYIGCIYFEDSQVDKSQIYYIEDDIIEIGTEGGGAIEIFGNQKDAVMRDTYLGALDGTLFNSGSHKVVGTCVVRTSYHLTATQQNELTEKIIKVITTEDISTLDIGISEIVSTKDEGGTEEKNSEGFELYNQDGYKIVCLGYENNNRMYGSNVLKLRIQNLNHYDVNIRDSGSYINGSMVRINAYFTITSGKEQTVEAFIDPQVLKDSGIERVEDITLNFDVVDGNSNYTLTKIGPLDISIDEEGNIINKIVYRDADTVKEVQTLLNQIGYNCGAVDGSAGKNTNNMILQFEKDHGLKEDTDITPELLAALHEVAGW